MGDGFLIFDLHHHSFMGPDVGHGIGEEVWAFLFQERCCLSLALGGFIDDLGLFLFFHLADDDAVSRNDFQCVYCCTFWKGKHVNAFHPAFRWIGEALGQHGAAGRTGNGD